MASWWQRKDDDVVLRHDCGTRSPMAEDFDECLGCGMTRLQIVEEAGEIPDDVRERRRQKLDAIRARRAEEEQAIRGARGEVQ